MVMLYTDKTIQYCTSDAALHDWIAYASNKDASYQLGGKGFVLWVLDSAATPWESF